MTILFSVLLPVPISSLSALADAANRIAEEKQEGSAVKTKPFMRQEGEHLQFYLP